MTIITVIIHFILENIGVKC